MEGLSMKKYVLIIISALGLLSKAQGQDYLTDYQLFFKGLKLGSANAPKVIELASPQINPNIFDGSNTSHPRNLSEAEELCRSLGHTQRATKYNTPSWDSLLIWSKPYIEKGILPLVLIDFRYEKLSDSFWIRQGYDYQTDEGHLVKKGPWVSGDFAQHDAFCFMPMFTNINPSIHSVILDPRFYISHRNIQSMNLGLDINGAELIVVPNVPTPIKNVQEGINNVFLYAEVDSTDDRIAFNKGVQINLTKLVYRLVTRVHLYFNPKVPEWQTVTEGLAIDQFDVSAYVTGESGSLMKTGAKVSIHYSNHSNGVPGCLNKPIIFVEGIDFGYRSWPTGCRDGKCGNTGYIDLLKGKQWDVETQTWTHWNAIRYSAAVLKQYRDSGYDIVYIDFWDGADLIENNAVVVKEAIRQIQQRLCGNHIHVVGASMGALVARRALTMLENDTLSHCVRSYTSFDGPLLGAVIPLSIQVTLDYYDGISGKINDLKERMLNRPAAKQLLLMHYQNVDKPHALRDKFMADSALQAFPKIPWKFAITNGSNAMIPQQGHNFYHINVGDSLMNFNIAQPLFDDIKALARKIGGKVLYNVATVLPESDAKLFLYSTGNSKLLPGKSTVALFKTTYKKLHSHNVDGSLGSYEHSSGGHSDFVRVFHESLQNYSWLIFSNRKTDETCFIPVWSALASDSVRIKSRNLVSETLGNQFLGLRNTPFDNYYSQRLNQDHVFLDDEKGGNADWLLKQIVLSERQIYTTETNEITVGKPYDRFIGNITVEKDHTLSINDDLSNSHSSPIEKAIISKLKFRAFYLGNCQPSEIRVKKGGVMNIGSGAAKNQTTYFQCRAASRITVEAGGTLKLTGGKSSLHMTNGTQLILEDGATLIVENGSNLVIDPKSIVWLGKKVKLQLNGNNAIIHVKGHLMLEDSCDFHITNETNSAVGLLKLSNIGGGLGSCKVSGSGNAILRIIGNDANGTPNLQIEGPIDFSGIFDSIIINRSNIKIGNHSQWNVSGNVYFNNCGFSPTEWAKVAQNGLRMYQGTLNVNGSKFENLNTGLSWSDNSKTHIQRCSFEQCNTGITALSSKFKITNTTFKKNTVGLEIYGADKHDSVVLCNFTANETGASINGNSKTSPLHLLENTFYSNTTGIESQNRTIALRCNIFGYNVTGIRATESTVIAGANSKINGELDTLQCGNNTFAYSQKRSIELNFSKPFFDGENNFLCPSTGSADSKIQIAGTIPSLISTPWNTKNTSIQLGTNHWFPLKVNSNFDSVNAKYLSIGCLDLGGKWYEIEVQGSLRKKINELCFDVQNSLQAARRAAGKEQNQDWSSNETPTIHDETVWLTIPPTAKVFCMDGREITPVACRNHWSDNLSTGFYLVQFQNTEGQWLSRKVFFIQPQ